MSKWVTLPLTLEPQPGGGYAVRSPELPELITEGDPEAQALENAWDALLAILDA
jgi:antitoxin HicB